MVNSEIKRLFQKKPLKDRESSLAEEGGIKRRALTKIMPSILIPKIMATAKTT